MSLAKDALFGPSHLHSSLVFAHALVATEALIFFSPPQFGWPLSTGCSSRHVRGPAAALTAREPAKADLIMEAKSRAQISPGSAVWDVVAGSDYRILPSTSGDGGSMLGR